MINVRRGANCSKKSEKVRKNRKKFEKIGLLSDKKNQVCLNWNEFKLIVRFGFCRVFRTQGDRG